MPQMPKPKDFIYSPTPGIDDKIVVWFSCGAASAVALKLTVEKYGRGRVRAVNQPIVEEGLDNRRFCNDVSEWVGIRVEQFTHSKFPRASAVEVWDDQKAMSFPDGATCTRILKKGARQQWEKLNNVDWHVFGFTFDEKKRHRNFVRSERENVLPVLIDAKLSKIDCALMLRNAGLKLPVAYSQGYPNANCKGCVKATSPTYWNLVRVTDPAVFKSRAEQSRRLGVRLVRVKGVRMFLDELDPKVKGNPLKSMPDCGIVCEENP